MIKFFLILILVSLLPAQAQLEKVSLELQWFKGYFQFAGYLVAQDKGYYRDAGLEVEIKEFNPKHSPLESVMLGKSTYGIGRPSIVIDIDKGAKIILLKVLFQSSPMGLMSLKKSGINTLKDIKGKRIMEVGSQSLKLTYKGMLGIANIDYKKDIQWIESNFKLDKLIKGEVDLMGIYDSDQPYSLQKKGYTPQLFMPSDYGFEFYDDILFSTENELKTHPKRVEKFVKASMQGWKYAFEHIEETAQFIFDHYNEENRTLDAVIFEGKSLKKHAYLRNIPLGNISLTKIEHLHSMYKSMGLASQNLDYTTFVYENDTFLEFLSKKFIYYYNNGDLFKILIGLMFLVLAISYWNWLLKKRVEEEIEKRLEQERLLFQQNRLSAMGEMISNIAHQWKQPLNTISLLLLNIDNRYHKKTLEIEYFEEKVKAIEESIEYMSQTIEDFSEYLTPEKEKKEFSIHKSIKSAIKLTYPLIHKENIQVSYLNTQEFSCLGHKNEFVQVLIIIINNAKDALIKDKDNNSKKIELDLKKSKDSLIITIKDNGLGVPEAIKDKIFDPYVTSNANTQGRGLGLYMAKMIVMERFKGTIKVNNDKGAVFDITLFGC